MMPSRPREPRGSRFRGDDGSLADAQRLVRPTRRAARAEPAVAAVPEFPLGVARGQVAATYIVAEAEDGLVIVDQHAAHERLVLERMRAAREGQGRSPARRC